MQKQWDSIDEIIAKSAPKFEVNEDYNNKLIAKCQQKNEEKNYNFLYKCTKNRMQVSAVSLIMTGFMIFILSTPMVQYKIIESQIKMKSTAIFIENNYNLDIIKNILGE